MLPARVRWSVRLPWSSAARLRRLVQIDGPGRPGDICGRALSHLLDQPAGLVAELVQRTATVRADTPTDRTNVVSLRMDSALIGRVDAWLAAHPEAAASWLTDAAIRTYLHICEVVADRHQDVSGLAPRRYRRLCGQLVVIVDEPHAA